jgi:CheY-like chemotaxis protein
MPQGVRDLRVLIIDPHQRRRAALCEQVAAWGVNVEAQEHVPDASTKFEGSTRRESYDVVLLISGTADGDAASFINRLRAVARRVAEPAWPAREGRSPRGLGSASVTTPAITAFRSAGRSCRPEGTGCRSPSDPDKAAWLRGRGADSTPRRLAPGVGG